MIQMQSKKGKASRTFARLAPFHDRQVNVSIRTHAGDMGFHYESEKKSIDIFHITVNMCAIDLPVIDEMNNEEILEAAKKHIAQTNRPWLMWRAGLRLKPRIHPWDEQELAQPTSVLRELTTSRMVQPLPASESAAARHVFLFALERN